MRAQPFPYPEDEALDQFIGTQADYYNVTQQMKRLIDRQHMKYSPALRAEVRKLAQWDEDLSFQTKHKIDSLDGLREYRAQTQSLIEEITERRKPMYKERQLAIRNGDTQQAELLASEIEKYKSCLAALRKEIRIANRIEDRMLNKIPAMLGAREAQQEIKERQEREAHERKLAYHRSNGGR